MMYSKFSNYENYTKNRAKTFKKPISMTLRSAGCSNIFEENKNNINVETKMMKVTIYSELLQEKDTKRNLNLIHIR